MKLGNKSVEIKLKQNNPNPIK